MHAKRSVAIAKVTDQAYVLSGRAPHQILRCAARLDSAGLATAREFNSFSLRAAAYNIVNHETLGGATSFALDVNNNRQVTGNSLVTSDPGATGSLLRAYVWSLPAGPMDNLGALPAATANRFARGYAINDSGVVVGEFNNDVSRAFSTIPSPVP